MNIYTWSPPLGTSDDNMNSSDFLANSSDCTLPNAIATLRCSSAFDDSLYSFIMASMSSTLVVFRATVLRTVSLSLTEIGTLSLICFSKRVRHCATVFGCPFAPNSFNTKVRNMATKWEFLKQKPSQNSVIQPNRRIKIFANAESYQRFPVKNIRGFSGFQSNNAILFFRPLHEAGWNYVVVFVFLLFIPILILV